MFGCGSKGQVDNACLPCCHWGAPCWAVRLPVIEGRSAQPRPTWSLKPTLQAVDALGRPFTSVVENPAGDRHPPSLWSVSTKGCPGICTFPHREIHAQCANCGSVAARIVEIGQGELRSTTSCADAAPSKLQHRAALARRSGRAMAASWWGHRLKQLRINAAFDARGAPQAPPLCRTSCCHHHGSFCEPPVSVDCRGYSGHRLQ